MGTCHGCNRGEEDDGEQNNVVITPIDDDVIIIRGRSFDEAIGTADLRRDKMSPPLLSSRL